MITFPHQHFNQWRVTLHHDGSSRLCLLIAWVMVTAWGLSGCAPRVYDPSSTSPQALTPLASGDILGQSFVARESGIQGVELHLGSQSPVKGELVLHLRSSPHSLRDLAEGRLSLTGVLKPDFYPISFPRLADSAQQNYFLLVEYAGEGDLMLGTNPGDSYLDGSLYRGNQAVDEQLAFKLRYDPLLICWNALGRIFSWIRVLLGGAFLFILPGWGLASALNVPKGSTFWPARLGIGAGLSLAIYPLLFLLTDLAGLHLGPLYAWIPGLSGLAALVWANRAWRPRMPAQTPRRKLTGPQRLPDLAYLVVAAGIVATRFSPITILEAPLFGDSYQHSLIVQLLHDHGGLFDSWAPYADLQTLTYHFGFHTLAAVFQWATGTTAPHSVLWTGQLVNLLAVLALYPLATRLVPTRWSGVVAILIAGQLAPMPNYYLNWGRYTQLAGQVVLPIAIWLLWESLERREQDWHLTGLIWVVLAGLALTHYRVLILALLFIPALLVFKARQGQLGVSLGKLFWMGLGAGLLFLPWFIHIFAGKILAILASQLTTPAGEPSVWQETNQLNLRNLSFYLPVWLWLAGLAGLIWGLLRRMSEVALIGLWSGLVFVAANPNWLGLPGAGVLTNFAVLLSAYLPAGLLIGAWLGSLLARWTQTDSPESGPSLGTPGEATPPERIRTGRAVTVILMVGALVAWGAGRRGADLQLLTHTLVTRPDLRATEWIQANLPTDTRFLVNSFFAYSDTLIAGSDGGWWLPLLARRSTTQPPLNYGSEAGPRPDYRQWINNLPRAIQATGIDSPESLAILKARGVTHVYIGQRQGLVNNPGPPLLDVTALLASEHYKPIYHEDRVWIFSLSP